MLKRGDELLESRRRSWRSCDEPRLLIITKANIHSRVHRRVYLDYIGVKRFDAVGNLTGELRIVGLFTSTAYTRDRAQHSLSAPQDRAASSARRLRPPTAIPARRWPTCWRIIRATSCSRSTRTRSIDFALAILQLDERPRVRVLARRDRFDRFVSVLVFVPRDRYDSDVRARIGDYLRRVFIGHVSAFYPFFPEGPLVRVHFIIGRSGGATPDGRRARRWNARSRPSCAPGPTRCRRAGTGRTRRTRRARCSRAIATRSPHGFQEIYAAGDCRQRYPHHRGADRRAPARRRFPATAIGRTAARVGLQGVELRPAAPAVGARAGAGEHGLHGGRRAHLPHRAAGRRRALVPRHAAGAARRRHDRSRRRQGAAGSRLPHGDARAGRERRLQRADAGRRASPGATWR